jgi:hypothetical protein
VKLGVLLLLKSIDVLSRILRHYYHFCKVIIPRTRVVQQSNAVQLTVVSESIN